MDINALLRPRWLLIAAVMFFVVGLVGLLLGEPRWSPMALFAGELLVILAAITYTTPSIPASLAAQAATREAAAREAAAEEVEPPSAAEQDAATMPVGRDETA